jgi:anti-sigma regulatory factor (Ser/Thr protein kinase)
MQNYGRDPGELPGNKNYIPITRLNVKTLHHESRAGREHVVDTVERESKRLALVLSKGNKTLQTILTYSIREIIRNVVEHSGSNEIWFSAQYWPTKDRVEIAILDEGIGINKSLTSNPRIKVKSEEDALLLSIEPGVTGTRPSIYDLNDPYVNSGFGLFVTSRICLEGGDYSICSGNKALGISSRKPTLYNTSFGGTAIRMRLITTRLAQLDGIIPRLIKEGEKLAKQNKRATSITASKISSLLVGE